MKNKKSLLIIMLLCSSLFLLSKCMNGTEAAPDPRGPMYAGASTCRKCHQSISDSFMRSAHYKSTSIPSKDNVHGDFNNGKNSFRFDATTRVTMEDRQGKYFQVLYKDNIETAVYPVDIVFGCRNAQSYVYWKDEQIFELPLSYYTSVNAWATSPGFSNQVPNFTRLINTECFDCHSSSLDIKEHSSMGGMRDQLDSASLIPGIDCERCHGPAQDHVNFHSANPSQKVAAYMVKNSELLQQQKLDACAICHSGNDQRKIQSRFVFQMGDSLDHFFMKRSDDHKTFDVHGNQYNLLKESKCFIRSKNITCGTCHDPHTNINGDLAIQSQHCINCHNSPSKIECPKIASLGDMIKNNCIDCHMPKQNSSVIKFQLSDSKDTTAYLLRTHKIGIYNNEKAAIHKMISSLK